MTLGQLLTDGYFYGMCLATLSSLVLIVLVARRARFSTTIAWFQLYMVGILLINLLTLIEFFALTPQAFTFVTSVIALAVVILFTGQLVFIMYFVGKSSWVKRWWATVAIAISGTAILFMTWNYHGFAFSDNPTHRTMQQWGYQDTSAAPGFNIVSTYMGIFTLVGLAALLFAYRRTKNADRRRQILIIESALIVPTVVGVVTQGILPQQGIGVPPLGSYCSTIAALLIGYMLIHYGTSSIDPEAITASIVQTMNSPAVALDSNYNIVFANAATQSLFGYAQAEIINQPISKLVGQAASQKLTEHLQANLNNTDNDQTFEARITARDGKQVAVNVYSSYYRDKKGQLLSTILVMADVQRLQDLKASVEQTVIERTHELHEEQAKLLASIEGLPSGFMLVDEQNAIVLQNEKLQTIFNLDGPATSLQQLGMRLTHANLGAAYQKVQKEKLPLVLDEVGLDAKILRLFLGPVRFKEENGTETIIGIVMLAEDITEEKILARSKDEFFSIASHELRTPLTSIKGNTSMLMQYFPDILKDPDVKEMITDVHDSSIRLIDIVNDFLDVSRLEQGKISFTYTAFSLEPLVEKIVYEMQAMLDERKLYLKFDKMTLDSLPKVWADENRTKQVIYNLVGNASKFTEKGGISISAAVEDGDLKVLVTDTGRGLSAANQQLLFHKFQQANTSLLTRDTSRGTGLGLYISKMIVENMGGVIKLERSEEGKGSTFSFTLPLATQGDIQHALDKAAAASAGEPQART
jgi:PAS domain S-box-containing protein